MTADALFALLACDPNVSEKFFLAWLLKPPTATLDKPDETSRSPDTVTLLYERALLLCPETTTAFLPLAKLASLATIDA